MTPEILGYVAAAFSTISFMPQALKTWRSRSAKDFSPFTLTIFTSGMLLWAAYGALIGDRPVVLCNLVLLGCMMPIIYVKLANRQRSGAEGR